MSLTTPTSSSNIIRDVVGMTDDDIDAMEKFKEIFRRQIAEHCHSECPQNVIYSIIARNIFLHMVPNVPNREVDQIMKRVFAPFVVSTIKLPGRSSVKVMGMDKVSIAKFDAAEEREVFHLLDSDMRNMYDAFSIEEDEQLVITAMTMFSQFVHTNNITFNTRSRVMNAAYDIIASAQRFMNRNLCVGFPPTARVPCMGDFKALHCMIADKAMATPSICELFGLKYVSAINQGGGIKLE